MPPVRLILFLLIPLFFLTGCYEDKRPDGPDIAYLAPVLPKKSEEDPQPPLLPLQKGAYWEMTSLSEKRKSQDVIKVMGPVREGSVSGIEVATFRASKKWRREIYTADKKGLALAAMQDETSGLMELSPPLPISRYPVREGDTLTWNGTLRLKKVLWPAKALSRISAYESVMTPAGRFKTYRIDTMIVINHTRGDISFPSVRWLAPGIGFVRRGFAEKSKSAYSEVTNFRLP